MSTDDSISEDVSSSGALSHCHVSADGDVDVDGGKESEISCVSSEGTSASGLAGLEDGHAQTPKTSEGAAGSRPVDITPACDKIRSLCLGTDEAFEPEKSLPFINPSSLETLRGLVQEIQSSGETDPEMWKDCEGRWLHLFQLVEKQYQEQILAQQEQYQCQIQLIQDEIKALVQLQNRQSVWQPHTEFTPTSVAIANPATAAAAAAPKGYGLTFTSNDPAASIDLPKRGADCRTAASHAPLSSPSPPPQRAETGNPGRATVMSSGYGTLSAWETGREETGCPGEEEDNHGQPEGSRLPEDEAEGSVIACQQSLFNSHSIHSGTKEPSLSPCQQRSFSVKPLTSWAQRQKLRPRKSKAAWAPSLGQEGQEPPASPRESSGYSPAEHVDLRDQHLPPGASTNSFPLRRSHSLLSEASGLTYWRLNENDLYHPLPDSLDSGAYLCLQEPATSGSGTLPQEAQRSLKEIYQSKQKMASKCADWDASFSSCPSSPQVLTLDPSLHTRQSDRTSGSTSPSRFGSPSFPPQLPLCPGVGTPVTPDGTGRCGAHPGNTDSASSTSSLLPLTTTSPKGVQSAWGSPSQAAPSAPRDETEPCFFITSQQHGAGALLANEEEEGRHAHTSTLKPGPASSCASSRASPRVQGATPLEDPVVLSLLRQNLREKHARHVADLKAYYESEIQALRDRLGLQDLPRDVERSNRALRERCRHLEKELSEATRRVQEAEVKHSFLEKKLEEWPERYAVAGAAVKSLQQRLEDSKRSGGEKDALAERLRARVRHLEEALQNACRETDEKEARREREHKMLQDLLGEYDSLRKDCEAGKDKLLSTENKLVDANEHVSELNRVISKLESQVKQLEHESQARLRFVSHGNTQPSGAGLFHHPDLLLSPSNTEPNVTLRRSPCSAADQTNGGRKSAFPQTNQSNGQKKSPNPSHDHSPLPGAPLESYAGWSSSPLPDRQQTWHQSPAQEAYGGPRDPGGREGPSPLTPVMRALMELEETRATESRAPWVGNQRATMGFVERRHKEPVHDRDKETSNAGTGLRGPERAGVRSSARPERPAALLRVQKSLSPDGHRSSSLPPSAHRSLPPATPTKRDTLLTPLSAKSSPKRSPTENYSTLFGHLLPRQQHLQNSLHRLDGIQDQRRHSVHNPSPRKRLQFSAPNEEEDSVAPGSPGSAYPSEGSAQLGWDEPGRPAVPNVRGVSCEYPGPPLLDRVHTLGEAEKLCDELTQEKLQIEAALSRLPGAGGRVSLQTRLDEAALERRLERLNRDLGSIRMTLKRFHVLRSSANV